MENEKNSSSCCSFCVENNNVIDDDNDIDLKTERRKKTTTIKENGSEEEEVVDPQEGEEKKDGNRKNLSPFRIPLPVDHHVYRSVGRDLKIMALSEEKKTIKFIHVTEKIHGCNVTLYVFKNGWQVATRNGMNGKPFKLRYWFERKMYDTNIIPELQRSLPYSHEIEKGQTRFYYYRIIGEFYGGGGERNCQDSNYPS